MINIAEILKNAPQGLKLYSLVHGEVTLESVDTVQDYYPIDIVDEQSNNEETLTKDGRLYSDYKDAECILFPSKEHKSWDNWQEVLFKIGDVVTCTKDINQKDKTFIITGIGGNFITLNNNKNLSYNNTSLLYRYATPEERKQFFKELNDNGYYWNENTKQMGKSPLTNTPKYKVGDWIKRLTPDNKEKKYFLLKVTGINDVSYQLENIYGNRYYKEKTFVEDEKYWELATEQELIDAGIKEKPFTIDNFKPFDKVLVRNSKFQEWSVGIFSHIRRYSTEIKKVIIVGGKEEDYCVPYNNETAHLLGTTDDCPDKYKTW